MNHQHDSERTRIRAAIERLLAGRPERSDGSFTVVPWLSRPRSTGWLCTSGTLT